MTAATFSKSLILLIVLLISVPAGAGQLVTASLKNGSYGTGTAVPPTTGVVNTADGVRFISTEPSGRSNGLVNWQIGNNSQWRRTGTITFLFKATRGQFVSGGIVGDNYGFGKFNNGQGTFGIGAGPAANGPGPEDDRVAIGWSTWHNNVWYSHATIQIEYDRWYSIGFAWGGPHEFEIWVDQELKSSVNLAAANFPWGSDFLQSGFNMGLGDNHERGVDAYNSAAGVMFADIRMWDEYRALGDTVSSNRPPTTNDDAYGVDEGATLTVAAPGVLDNDDDPDGDELQASLLTGVAHGTLTLAADGSLVYQPNPGYHGTDGFTYRASDGNDSAEATVTITINPVNDAPVANADSASTLEDTPVVVDVLANDSDADGDALMITQAGVSIGVISFAGGSLSFTPPANFFGAVTASYSISDGQGGTAQGTVAITVTAVNDAPVASADTATATGGTTVIDVLANDSDVDGDPLSITEVSAPILGGAVISGGVVEYRADVFGRLAADIDAIPGLNHGHRTSLNARLRNAQRAFERGHMDTGLRELLQIAEALERFSRHELALRVAAALRALGGGATLTDSFTYTIGDGHGGSATAVVTVTIQLF